MQVSIANYVLENDNLLVTQRPEYDVIMCLSVTKWVHLNWGDCGLKRLFKRVYSHLRPGGVFILEPQPWDSYDEIGKNFHNIRLRPDQFSSYLTTEVGFASAEFLGAPKCSIRGFQRPLYLFHK
ncbi:7SK snRNA methylphosphate capping enzyme [Liparis tanakae]|uniref:RNA methyltransferase n=1 Tax=Liparis tanakae TaxID=230148 RepID=A0A4Z2FB02_9TELE|nr:7SK snRNA methylphosphate capping enzyme [Liparis tanakae]